MLEKIFTLRDMKYFPVMISTGGKVMLVFVPNSSTFGAIYI